MKDRCETDLDNLEMQLMCELDFENLVVYEECVELENVRLPNPSRRQMQVVLQQIKLDVGKYVVSLMLNVCE